MADKQTLTNKEMIDLLLHKASEQQIGDNFRVKVHRRSNNGTYIPGAAQHVCTLKDAMVIHLANPETWIPQLLGGGAYALIVYPGDNMTTPIGSELTFTHAGVPSREIVDFDAPKRTDWAGPAEIIWPQRPNQQQPSSMFSVAPQSATQGTAPQTIVPGSGPAGGQFNQQQWVPSPSTGPSPELVALQQRERELAGREMQLREEALRRETQLVLDKARQDMDAERARMKAEMDMIRTQASAPRMNIGEIIAGITAALTPIAALLMDQSKTTRELAARQAEQAQLQQNKILEMIVSKPAISPEMQLMMERLTPKDNTTSAEMLHSITDTMRNMTSMTMDALAQASEMQGGQRQESTGMLIVKEMAKLAENLGGAGSRAMMQRQPAPHPRPIAVRALPGSAAAPLPQAPQHVGATPLAQPQHPAFNGVPQAQQQVAPQVDQLQQLIRSGLIPANIAPTRMPDGNLSFPSAPAALEFLIRTRDEPTKIIAVLRDNISDATLRHEFMQAGGVIELFERRLGREWMQADPANQPYMHNLAGLIQEALQDMGIIQGGAQEEEQEEQEQEAGPEDAQYVEGQAPESQEIVG